MAGYDAGHSASDAPLLSLELPEPGTESRAARVAAAIEKTIHDENMGPGAFVGTRAMIRKQLSISAATLDGAVKLLIDRGVISTRPGVNGGIRVAGSADSLSLARSRWSLRTSSGVTPEVGYQAASIMLTLWPLVVAEAAARITDEGRAKLRQALRRMEEGIGDLNAFYTAHDALHEMWLELSMNTAVQSVYMLLNETVHRTDRLPDIPATMTVAEYTRERYHVHERICEGIDAGDAEEAWRGLLDHGVTRADVQEDTPVLPPGYLLFARQWAAGLAERE